MPGFAKENCGSQQDDEPPETRNLAPKGVAPAGVPLSSSAKQLRERLGRLTLLTPHSPDFKDAHVAARNSTIKELMTALSKPPLFKELIEPNLDALFGFIGANLFRPLRHSSRDFPSDGDEPGLQLGTELNWVHLHPVYQVLSQLFLHPLVDRKQLRNLVDTKFVSNYLDLFESEDPLERETLKLTLHRIYIQLVSRRKQIRSKIYSIFECVVNDQTFHPGLGELTEFLSSVVAGFNSPLQEEHLATFRQVVLPLIKLPNFRDFQKPLGTCLALYISKDRQLAVDVVRAMLRFWPNCNVKKETAFLAQISEVAEQVGGFQVLRPVFVPLAKRVAKSVASLSPSVCDKALVYLLDSGFQLGLREVGASALPVLLSAATAARTRQSSKALGRVLDRVIQTLKELVGTAPGVASPPLHGSEEYRTHRSQMEGRWEELMSELFIREPDFEAPRVPYTDTRLPE